MKKLISLFMSFVMFLSITAGLDLTANAEVLSGDCGADGSNVTYTLDTDTGVLTISGTGKMYDYSPYPYAPWYSNRSSVKTVIINSGVTSIGDGAFEFCYSLTSITIPNSVTSIGGYAFECCSSLTSVTIGNSVTSLGYGAFYYCSSLTSVVIGNSVTSIGSSAFSYCSSLISITIPNSVTSIGSCAFYSCDSLTSITIPNSVTSIGNQTFSYCRSLTSITIPDSVTSIGNSAFSGCSSLTSVTIPDSVTSIGDSAFGYCSSLKCVFYKGSEDDWSNISIGSNNDSLKNANIHYNSTDSDGYIPEIIEPICNQGGYTVYKCSVCGNSYNADKTSALGHSFTNYVSDGNATCTSHGTKTAKCDRCDVTDTISDVGSKLGHSFNGGKNCVVCGAVNPNYVEPTPMPTPTPQPQPTPTQPTTTVPVQTTTQPAQTTTSTAVKKPKSTSISKLTKGKKQFKVAWKKVSGVAGYQIQYSTDKKFKKNNKTVTVNKSSSSSTIKKLKSKKTYYVRIRTYKTVEINGKSTKVYSSWSKVKTVKTK